MLQDPMGLRTGGDLSWGFETSDCGFLDSSFAPTVDTSGDGETFSSYTTTSSGASYDGSSSNSNNNNNNYNFISDASLSSYLMDGNVRAMLKKVTVNEGVLNRTIQSLGGGEKGLKELMGYIMSWVQEHQNENSDYLSLSHRLERLHSNSNNRPPPVFGHGQGCLDEEANQLYQPCSKSRRVGDRPDVYRGAGVVSESEFQYPKFEMAMQHPQQQPVNPSSGLFSFASGQCDLNRPGRDDLSRTLAATTTRAARRNRIARQRLHSLPRNASTPAAWTGGALALNTGTFHPQPVAVPGRKANNAEMLTFLLQKELRPSDVGNLGRIILPKKEAEMHLPILALREGVLLLMEDFDTGYCWNIRYRFWPNNKSRMYLLENTGELVKQHQLQEGDILILYRNPQGNYVLRGKKKVLSGSRGVAQQNNAHSLARGFPEASKTEEVLKERDYIVERGFGLEFQEQSCQRVQCKDNNRVALEMGPQVVKAEPIVRVGDDDPFFKEDVMHNIGSSFGPGLLQPLERFPSLNLDFPFEEILAGIPKDDSENESSKMVPKTELVE